LGSGDRNSVKPKAREGRVSGSERVNVAKDNSPGSGAGGRVPAPQPRVNVPQKILPLLAERGEGRGEESKRHRNTIFLKSVNTFLHSSKAQ